MKHKTLEELLEHFSEDVIFWICNKGTQDIKTTVKNYLEANSLAVEQEAEKQNKTTFLKNCICKKPNKVHTRICLNCNGIYN